MALHDEPDELIGGFEQCVIHVLAVQPCASHLAAFVGLDYCQYLVNDLGEILVVNSRDQFVTPTSNADEPLPLFLFGHVLLLMLGEGGMFAQCAAVAHPILGEHYVAVIRERLRVDATFGAIKQTRLAVCSAINTYALLIAYNARLSPSGARHYHIISYGVVRKAWDGIDRHDAAQITNY